MKRARDFVEGLIKAVGPHRPLVLLIVVVLALYVLLELAGGLTHTINRKLFNRRVEKIERQVEERQAESASREGEADRARGQGQELEARRAQAEGRVAEVETVRREQARRSNLSRSKLNEARRMPVDLSGNRLDERKRELRANLRQLYPELDQR